jgi:hypothetical protein
MAGEGEGMPRIVRRVMQELRLSETDTPKQKQAEPQGKSGGRTARRT